MATITESSVWVQLRVVRTDEGVRILADAASYTADGARVREVTQDITNRLSVARRQGATDLLADVEAAVKQQWQIP